MAVESILLILFLSLAVGAFITRLLIPVAVLFNLVDVPGGRKDHDGAIPLVGGIAVFAAAAINITVFAPTDLFVRFFLVGCSIMVLIGAIDDRYQINARFRLVAQLLIAGVFAYGLGLTINNYGNLLGFGDIHTSYFAVPLTVLSIVAAINGFNMMDGVDGLVGSIGLVSFAALAVLFSISGDITGGLICFSFIGALLTFLVFNIRGRPGEQSRLSKVFMGDAGSMLVGLAIAVLLVYGSQVSPVNTRPAFEPIVALWFVLLPVTDMATIMYRRLKRGRSPMSPDRTHIHHVLMRAGLSKSQTLGALILIHSFFVGVGIGFTLTNTPPVLSLALAVGFIALYQMLMRHAWKFVRKGRELKQRNFF